MKYGNRSLGKRLVGSPFVMVGAALLLAVLAKAGWNIYGKARVSDDRLVQAQAELAKLRDRETELSAKVGYLSTEQGMETEIRTKYHAVKEGESVAVIVDDAKTATVANASNAQATSSPGWFRRVLRAAAFWR